MKNNCPLCKMPERGCKQVIKDQYMIFYECGTTEISENYREQADPEKLKERRYLNKQSAPCKEIVMLRNEVNHIKKINDGTIREYHGSFSDGK